MTRVTTDTIDRRVGRTRTAVFGAFVRLAFDRRYSAIRTADLIAEAGIGRSTFYEHFRGKDDVLIAVIDPIFVPLAEAVAGRGNLWHLRAMLEHVWEQRALGRILFEGRLLLKLQRKLAGMIEARLDAGTPDTIPPAMIAMAAATAQLAMLRMWLAGEAPCPAAALARHLMDGAAIPQKQLHPL